MNCVKSNTNHNVQLTEGAVYSAGKSDFNSNIKRGKPHTRNIIQKKAENGR